MVFKNSFFRKGMWHSRPPRDPPPFMAKAILNFHFDFLTTSLRAYLPARRGGWQGAWRLRDENVLGEEENIYLRVKIRIWLTGTCLLAMRGSAGTLGSREACVGSSGGCDFVVFIVCCFWYCCCCFLLLFFILSGWVILIVDLNPFLCC